MSHIEQTALRGARLESFVEKHPVPPEWYNEPEWTDDPE